MAVLPRFRSSGLGIKVLAADHPGQNRTQTKPLQSVLHQAPAVRASPWGRTLGSVSPNCWVGVGLWDVLARLTSVFRLSFRAREGVALRA